MMASGSSLDDPDSDIHLAVEASTNESERNGLTDTQLDSLTHFQDIAGGLEVIESRRILETHDWNLESAVNTFMGIATSPPTLLNGSEGPDLNSDDLTESVTRHRGIPNNPQLTPTFMIPTRVPDVFISPHQRIIRHSRSGAPQSWFRWTFYIIRLPFQMVYNSFIDIVFFLLSFVRPDPRRQVTDPEGDVRRFIEDFESNYGTEHPNFFLGSYSQALQVAKAQLKFLVVYLHGDSHEDTPEFCRTTLCNPAITTLLNESMVFWACNINSPEGFRVSQNLREHSYPFLAVIVLHQSRMTLVARIEEAMTPEELAENLNTVMRQYSGSIGDARRERTERETNQLIRREQDQAYQESLRQDQEKEARKEAERLAEVRQVEEEENRVRDEEARILSLKQRKAGMLTRLPAEPESKDADAVKIVLKLPSGPRLERRFCRTDSVKLLYYFVLSNPASPENFEILRNFPSRVLACCPENIEWDCEIERTPRPNDPDTFEQLGLTGSEMILVRDTDA